MRPANLVTCLDEYREHVRARPERRRPKIATAATRIERLACAYPGRGGACAVVGFEPAGLACDKRDLSGAREASQQLVQRIASDFERTVDARTLCLLRKDLDERTAGASARAEHAFCLGLVEVRKTHLR